MARRMAADGLELFRAVVTETRTRDGEEPTTSTSYFGPFNKVGTAKAQVTMEKRVAEYATANSRRLAAHLSEWKPTVVVVTGRVEKAAVTWEAVDV
jgi:hypothetical protein